MQPGLRGLATTCSLPSSTTSPPKLEEEVPGFCAQRTDLDIGRPTNFLVSTRGGPATATNGAASRRPVQLTYEGDSSLYIADFLDHRGRGR